MGAFAGSMPAGALNVALSNFAKEFRNNALVGELIAPRVPVDRQSFQYVIFDRSDFRLDKQTLRAPGDKPQTDRMNYSVAPYMCRSHALEAVIPFEQEQYTLGLGFSERQKATQRLLNKLNLDRENYIAQLVLTSTNLASSNYLPLSGTSMWDDYTHGVSHPITVIDQAKAQLRQTGIQDTDMVLVLSDPTYTALQNHPDLIDRFKYTNAAGNIGLDQMSQVFKVKCVLASAVKLSNANVASFIWGQNAVLLHAQSVTNQQDISALKTFVWTAAPDSVDGYGVIEFPNPHLSAKSTIVSVDWYWDIRITAQETVYVIANTCAAPTMEAIAAPTEG